jgi:predicted glycosyltransferase
VQEVLARLHDEFDALMIHADERFTRLEEFFPAVADIDLPVEYTGIVSEKFRPSADKARMIRELTGAAPFVLASVGGGTDPGGLISRCIDAWDRLVASGAAGARRLVLAEGLGWPVGRHREIEARLRNKAAILLPFTADFLHWMHATDLSVSCAGYNTCANILETGARALLIPNPEMPDQALRAARFAAHGLAEVLESRTLTTERLADAIAKGLTRPRAGHDLELNGAGRTREFIERLAG